MDDATSGTAIARAVSARPAHLKLLQHAQSRGGWQKLTQLQKQRAEALLLAADSPELHIIAVDNVALQKRLRWSTGQAQDMVRALKRARLLAVVRRWETLPNGRKRELGPASWIYTADDALRPSQIPKARVKKTEPRIRALESQVALLFDEVTRLRQKINEIGAGAEACGQAERSGVTQG